MSHLLTILFGRKCQLCFRKFLKLRKVGIKGLKLCKECYPFYRRIKKLEAIERQKNWLKERGHYWINKCASKMKSDNGETKKIRTRNLYRWLEDHSSNGHFSKTNNIEELNKMIQTLKRYYKTL